ncbi:MAG: hypothetical protein AAFQ84_09010 [Pseudomonadota bacterium]
MRASRNLLAGWTAIALSACATPGIDYTARVAPGNPDAATFRTVAVSEFSGPFSAWYTDQFEAMLEGAVYEGAPWFDVGLFPAQSNVVGVYDGWVDISYPDIFERFYTTSDCLKRDEETDKCLKKVEIEHVCVRYTVAASAHPRLIDKATGDIIHEATYLGEDSEEECFETGHVEYRIRRQPGDPGKGKYRFAYDDYINPGYRPGPGRIIDRISAGALYATLWQVRQDIAPYNQVTRATILTEAQDFEVAADPRFAQAVDAIKDKQPQIGCALFNDLAARYPSAPAVLHNAGACAEASGDQTEAQALYGSAAAAARALGVELPERMLQALSRISIQRVDEQILQELVLEEPDPVPAS